MQIKEDLDSVGHALIRVPVVAPAGGLKLRIRRLAGSPDWLGPLGWQSDAADLAPVDIVQASTNTMLRLGPDICDHLLEDTEVEVSVPALNLRETVVWPYVTPRQSDGVNGVHFTPRKATEASVQTTAGGTGTASVDDELERTVHMPPQPPQPWNDGLVADPPFGPDEEPRKIGGWRWVVAVPAVLLIAAVAAAAWVLRPPEPHTPVATVPAPDVSTTAEPAPEQRVEPEPAVAPEPAEAPDTPDALMQAARDCRATGCPADEVFALAQRLEAISAMDNAITVADAAATAGSEAARIWMGQLFDPLTFQSRPGGPSAPDPLTALRYYRSASGASAAIEALCAALADPASLSGVSAETAALSLAACQ